MKPNLNRDKLPLFLLMLVKELLATTLSATVIVLPAGEGLRKGDAQSSGQCASQFAPPLAFNSLTRTLTRDVLRGQTAEALSSLIADAKTETYRRVLSNSISEEQLKQRREFASSQPAGRTVDIALFLDNEPTTKQSFRGAMTLSSRGSTCVDISCSPSTSGTLPADHFYPHADLRTRYPNAIEAGGFTPGQDHDPMLAAIDLMLAGLQYLSLFFSANTQQSAVLIIVAVEDLKPNLISVWKKIGFVEDRSESLTQGRVLFVLHLKEALIKNFSAVDLRDTGQIGSVEATMLIGQALSSLHPQVASRNAWLHFQKAWSAWLIPFPDSQVWAQESILQLHAMGLRDERLDYLEVFIEFSSFITLHRLDGDTEGALLRISELRQHPRFADLRLMSYPGILVLDYLEAFAKTLQANKNSRLQESIEQKQLPPLTHSLNNFSSVDILLPQSHQLWPTWYRAKPILYQDILNKKVSLKQVWKDCDLAPFDALSFLFFSGHGLEPRFFDLMADVYCEHFDLDCEVSSSLQSLRKRPPEGALNKL